MHHLVVGLHALGAGVADVDRLGEDLAVDLHHRHAGLLEVRADEAVGRAVDDVDDAAFGLAHAADAAATAGRSPCRRWRRRRRLGGNEDVGVAPRGCERALGPHEAEAALGAAERADDVLVIALDFACPLP